MSGEGFMNYIRDIQMWEFSHCTLLELPLDSEQENYVKEFIAGAVFSVVMPTPFATEGRLVAFSEDVLRDCLDLDPCVASTKDFIDFVSGQLILTNSVPLAHRYAGHQFGTWKKQLGDGRAIFLGEYVNR